MEAVSSELVERPPVATEPYAARKSCHKESDLADDQRRRPTTALRNWSIPIGKLFGVEVRVHFTFVFLLGFIWMAESSMPKSNSTPGRVLGLVGIIFGAVVL